MESIVTVPFLSWFFMGFFSFLFIL